MWEDRRQHLKDKSTEGKRSPKLSMIKLDMTQIVEF